MNSRNSQPIFTESNNWDVLPRRGGWYELLYQAVERWPGAACWKYARAHTVITVVATTAGRNTCHSQHNPVWQWHSWQNFEMAPRVQRLHSQATPCKNCSSEGTSVQTNWKWNYHLSQLNYSCYDAIIDNDYELRKYTVNAALELENQ